jgi:branched-chain amino acid transport system permease protein
VLATLLGGVHAFAGPIVGAILFLVIRDVVVRFTEYWLIVFGVIVVALVMGFPEGVMSIFRKAKRGPRRLDTQEQPVEATRPM